MLFNSPLANKPVSSKYRSLKLNAIVFTLAFGILFSHATHSESIVAVDAATSYGAETTYSIYRKGKVVGKHILKIKTDNNNRVDVSVDSRITIRVLKIPVFKFSYVSEEIWESNVLRSVESTTTTNKEIEIASLFNSDGSSSLQNNDGNKQEALIKFATNHWHIGAVEQSTLFNTVKGTLASVNVEKSGTETLKIGDINLPVTHFKYSGDIVAESWYDDNNRWVKLAFLGSDGSQITYVIDNPLQGE